VGSPAAVGFCAALPALVRTKRGLQAWFVARPDDVARSDSVDQPEGVHAMAREAGLRDLGVTRATLLTLAPQDFHRQFPLDPSGCQYALLGTQPTHFAQHYVQQGEPLNAIAERPAPHSAAADLIDWPAGQKLPGIVGCRHH